MSEVEQGSQEEATIKVIPPKKIVRRLAVGNEVQGRVKRLADFGAFIDIGVGTDALVHVSEMGQKRVNKPKDVLSVGDEVTAWIKALDKDRNRISLTLLSPDTRTIRDLTLGEVIEGSVTRITNFGAFVDFGIGYEGMVHVKEMAHGYVKHPNDVVEVGQTVEAEILKINRRRGQIDLSMRAIMPEPEAKARPEPQMKMVEDLIIDDEEEEESLPTAFEMALQRAQSNRAGKGRKRRKKQWYDEMEDEDDVVERTLSLADEA